MISEVGFEYKFRVYDNAIQQIVELARCGNQNTHEELDYLLKDLDRADRTPEPFAYFETNISHGGLKAREKGIIAVRRGENFYERGMAESLREQKPRMPVTSFEDITLEQFCFKSWELNRIRTLYNEGRADDAVIRFCNFVNSFSRVEINLKIEIGNEKLRIIDRHAIGIMRG